ncbi:MAG: hypothetical protein M3Q83_00255 [Pseudomonadota bacterium]|nr:hypothetical protein [Pseudomonadota bacterium]
MELRQATGWVDQHRWWVGLVIVIVAGYSLGKDLAMRDNRADARSAVEGNQ